MTDKVRTYPELHFRGRLVGEAAGFTDDELNYLYEVIHLAIECAFGYPVEISLEVSRPSDQED